MMETMGMNDENNGNEQWKRWEWMMDTMGMDDEKIGTVRQKQIWLQPNKHSTGAKPSRYTNATLFRCTLAASFRLLSELPILIAARHIAAGALRVLSLESG